MGSAFITYNSQPPHQHNALHEAMNRKSVDYRTHAIIQELVSPHLKEYLPFIKEWKCEDVTLCTIFIYVGRQEHLELSQLHEIKFSQLRRLCLYHNEIESIELIARIQFPQVRILNLGRVDDIQAKTESSPYLHWPRRASRSFQSSSYVNDVIYR